jgi:hypothetical protein
MVNLPREASSPDCEGSSDGSAILDLNRAVIFALAAGLLLTQICVVKAVGFGADGQYRNDEIAKLQTNPKAL